MSLPPAAVSRGLLRLSTEVERALRSPCGPLASRVVLLESAILTHGMPFPDNVKMARDVQDIVREKVGPAQ